jgi:PAS domain S-box-containing protein
MARTMAAGDDFSTLFELLPIGAYRTDAQSRQLRANSAMVRIFGFESEAQMIATSSARPGQLYAQPGRRAEFRALLEAQGYVRDFVSEMRRFGTGERFWITENAHLVRDAAGAVLYYEGTIEDITERVRAQEALQLTLDNAGRGIARLDAEGHVVLYNRQCLELLDLPEALLARRPLMREVIAFQEARGDFGANKELLDEGTRMRIALDSGPFDLHEVGQRHQYLRRTRHGRYIEVATQPLPDGGAVRTYSDVTAYVRAQQELAHRTRDLQITLDSMAQGIATIDASGRTVMSNRRHHELLGFSEELMATQPTMEQLVRFQIARGDFGENFAYVDAVARGYVAVGATTRPIDGPETYLRKTRDGRTLEVLTRPLPDGGVVRTFTDMTAYVRAQEALAQKEAQLSALVNNLPDRVWLKDAQGVYRLSNPAHHRHWKLGERDVVGHTAEELFGAEVGARQRRTDAQAMASAAPIGYEERSFVEGRWQTVDIVKVPMRDEAGACTGVLGIARDITARKEAEAALIAAKEAAEAGERAKAEFLANMSHEIRTPMNAVIGMSDLLLDSPLTAQQREFAETIRTSGDALLSLINDILDFSRIESGHLVLENVPLDVSAWVESALELSGATAAAKGLEMVCWVEDDVPPALLGDPARLRQVLVNLVSNAVKFTREGEVMVTVSRRAGEGGAPLLHAAVRDTGIGIPADRMGRLFQVFSQVDASTTREYGGTGLGLAICRRLVTMMGGRIWVESVVGQGSTFQFELPLHEAPAVPAAAAVPGAARLAGKRVLVVDDNEANRQILTLQMRRWGIAARAAASALEALAWVDAGEVFDAAVLDVQMPGMDGYTLSRELHRREASAAWPVLVLTSLATTRPPPQTPVAMTLTKPVKAQALLAALSGVLQQREAPPTVAVRAGNGAPGLAEAYPLRLLLAEDNVVNQRVASLILNRLGYEIEVVTNGHAALEHLAGARQRGKPIDVVLMDVQMPELDGLETTRRLLHEFPRAAERPWVVAMTANAMDGDREECLAAGMDDYLSKPIRPVEVSEALRQAALGLAARRA